MLYSFSLRPFGGGGLKVSRISLICLGAMVPPLRTLAMTTDTVFDISVELTERVMLIDQMSQWGGRIFDGKPDSELFIIFLEIFKGKISKKANKHKRICYKDHIWLAKPELCSVTKRALQQLVKCWDSDQIGNTLRFFATFPFAAALFPWVCSAFQKRLAFYVFCWDKKEVCLNPNKTNKIATASSY